MTRRLRLLSTLALFLGGCTPSGNRFPPTVPGLDSIPEVFRIEESGIDRKSRWVVASRPAWDSLWTRITRASIGPAPLPANDFSRQMLVVATSGAGSASSPHTRFQGYRIRGDTLEVFLLLTFPGGDCSGADDFSHPIVIGRIPRWEKTVRFFDQETAYCGGRYRDTNLHLSTDTVPGTQP